MTHHLKIAEIASRNAPKKNVVIFLIKSGLGSLLAIALIAFVPMPLWHPFQEVTANIVAWILRTLHYKAFLAGTVISGNTFSMQVIHECLGIELFALLFVFVVSFPATFRQKGEALTFGIPIVFSANIFRMVFLFVISSRYPDFFHIAHTYLGQTAMLVLMVVLAFFWMTSVSSLDGATSPRRNFGIRLLATASVLFPAWCWLDSFYLAASMPLAEFLTKTFTGLSLNITTTGTLPHTFSLVSYSALILADRKFPWRWKAPVILLGFPPLFLSHLTFSITNILSVTNNSFHFYRFSYAALVVGSFFLPVALWLVLRTYTEKPLCCPLCGAPKRGLLDHIRFVHGQEALSDPEVIRLKKRLSGRRSGLFFS